MVAALLFLDTRRLLGRLMGAALAGALGLLFATTSVLIQHHTMAASPDVSDLPSVNLDAQPGAGPFLHSHRGAPTTFLACPEAIDFWTWIEPGPANGDELIAEAISEISRASGIPFVHRGPADQLQLPHLGLVIGFARSDHGVFEGDDVAGVSRGQLMNGRMLRSVAVVNVDAQLSPDSGPGSSVGNVLLHEIGHSVGLAHRPEDTTSIMYPVANPDQEDGLNADDRAALAELGRSAGCRPGDTE